MTQLTIYLLGTVQITHDGKPATDQTYAKVLGLLAYLAVEADRPHSRATLATLFWPEQSDERARHSLRQALSTLRKTLREPPDAGLYLVATREFVQFNREGDYALDVRRVIDLLETCERHEHQRLETCPACAQRLEQVVSAFRGDFLEGFSVDDSSEFEDWVQIWRQRIRQQVIKAASTLAAWHEYRGALDLACDALTRLLQLDPWQEGAHRTLMELLWRRGMRAEAMAQYERCRKVLDDELGIEPDEETTALYDLISSPGAKPNPAPGQVARTHHSHRLPSPVGRLVGRDRDLESIADLLAQRDCRLLTLTGPGGSGKTRLAIQVATEQTHHFVGSICFVSLAETREADGIIPAIADELGMRRLGNADPERQLLDWMRDRSIFLVLDNAEHLVDGMVIASRILASAPGVTILATSREQLHLHGEWVYEVNGLDVPASDATDSFEGYGSVELFGERLRQVRPRTPLHHEERPTVVRICQLVGGLPLAIELAAAWAQSLTLEQIEDGVRKNLDFLSTSMRDTPARHRSMRAVFIQTWELLTAEEQTAYRTLSVFQDGFRLEAAEAVTATSSFQLATLVAKSLVTRLPNGRYRLHGLLRQFADEQVLKDTEEHCQLHDRQCTYYLEQLGQREEALIGRDQRAALGEIEDDIGNIRAAWDWAVKTRKVLLIAETAHALWLFYVIRGWMRDGAAAFGSVLEALGATDGSDPSESSYWTRARATSLARYGGFRSGLGRYDEGITSLSESIAILREDDAARELGLALNMLAAAHQMKGDLLTSRRLLEESLVYFREADDQWGIAMSLNDLGLHFHQSGASDDSERFCEESRKMFREIGDRRGNAFAAYNLGMIAARNGDHERAKRWYRESLALRQDSHDQWGIAASLVQLGTGARALGSPQEARAMYLKALRIAWDSSMTPVVLDALAGVSVLLIDEGDDAQAQEMLAAISAHPATSGQLQERIAEMSSLPVSTGAPPRQPATYDRWAVEAIDDIARVLVG